MNKKKVNRINWKRRWLEQKTDFDLVLACEKSNNRVREHFLRQKYIAILGAFVIVCIGFLIMNFFMVTEMYESNYNYVLGLYSERVINESGVDLVDLETGLNVDFVTLQNGVGDETTGWTVAKCSNCGGTV